MNTDTVYFEFSELSRKERYKLLIGTVFPRPIALVTTVDENGVPNAAPFSFFNCLSDDPAIVALGIENGDDMKLKDTARNIRMTEEFTVNIVSDAIVEAMRVCAVPFPASTNELEMAGLTAVPGTTVQCPRIAKSPAAFECRRYMTLELGKARQIILGEVVGACFHKNAIDTEKMYVDHDVIDAVGRAGGQRYVRSRSTIELPTISLDEWTASRG
jgi:flavin reductase (DIM6/NTAB) family NADH-FMN oxidoreductase RutF